MFLKMIGFLLSLSTALSFMLQRSVGKDAVISFDYGDAGFEEIENPPVKSCVKECGDVPTLFVNGEPYPALAYMTYLENYACYDQFADAGYTLFSLPTLFSGRWISVTEGLTPFSKGIFDEKGNPDFSVFDKSVEKVLKVCPNALIFPRVNVSMPLWWIEENTDKLDSTGKRESLYSSVWREDAADMLRAFINHVLKSDFASHIVGYQIAGGNTEEWFHFDMNAGLSKSAEMGFKSFLEKYYPDISYSGLPDLSLLRGKGVTHGSDYLARFFEYASFAVADDIAYLANVAKKASGGHVVIGTFYGYDLEVSSQLHGTHGLRWLLQSDDIDFICSPNSYIGVRDEDADWTEMYPADSVRLHGKLCLQECDIRTYLTRPLGECAPETDPNGIMSAPIWQPVKDKQTSVSMIRKSFCRQLIKGNGFWWFDMWGGWYDDPDLMAEMEKFRSIYVDSLTKPNRKSVAQVAVFIDESAYKYMKDGALLGAIYNQRKIFGFLGAPYDIYDISDFDEVADRYKAVIFMTGVKTQGLENSVGYCRKNNIPFLMNSSFHKFFSLKALKAFCRANGVHLYIDTEDLMYIGAGYIAFHATEGGEKTISFEKNVTLRSLFGEPETYSGKKVTVNMQKGETALFEFVD
ncbi:MAG: hypothetical protein K6B52_01130 [Clostridiales bacterium]|nr:hypothetical protein [Clostridiales bacterium]